MPRVEGAWSTEPPAGGWLLGGEDSLTALLGRSAAAHADKLLVDFSGETFTYADVDRESAKIARGLRELGIGAGDVVSAIVDNSPDAVLLWLATTRLGAIYAPINTAFKGEYLRHQIADSRARIVVSDDHYVDRITAVAAGTPNVELILQRGDGRAASPDGPKLEMLDDHRLDGDDDPSVACDPSDIALIIYTGGTTGPSKGCALSHAYIVRMSRSSLFSTDRRPDELNWNPCPLFHLNAPVSIVGSMLLGGAASIAPRFSVSNFWSEIERTGARIVNLLGTMIPLLAQMPDSDDMARCKGQIRAIAGAPFTAATEATFRDRFGVELVGNPFFGQTECAPMTLARLDEPKPQGACGRIMDDLDVRIFDDDDNELPAGEVGEIVVRPLRPNAMFSGYWKRPEATLSVFGNLWFHTGDLARFDEDGWMYFVDRKKDYLRRGGENISSFEMEATFLQHPHVAEVAVHAVPSELSEDEVKVTAVLAADAAVTEEELCHWCIDKVPYFAVPRYIEFRTELPKNDVGRILKFQLRDEGRTPSTWDRVEAGVTFERR